ncbi:MAG TPA: 2-oxoacid:acceptor oxidoreductase family protein [Myxococcales bacterium]
MTHDFLLTTVPPKTRPQLLRQALERGEAVLVRAHGEAGGGALLALQAFGAALASHRALQVQEWPSFPPNRKGGPTVAWLRVARSGLEAAAPIGAPEVVVRIDGDEDGGFAEGTRGALFVLNTALPPDEAARRWRLGGTIVTVDGAALGRKHLGRPLAGVAVLAALAEAVDLEPQAVRTALRNKLREHGQPETVVEANLALFTEALGAWKSIDWPEEGAGHPPRAFRGFGELPAGAQTGLRSVTRGNR